MPSFNESEASRDAIAGGQPAPKPNNLPAVWSLVIADMQARDQIGRQRYGTPLQPFNGRDALRDAYEEGPDCYEDPEDGSGHLGKAVRLDNESFRGIADLLNSVRPRADASSGKGGAAR